MPATNPAARAIGTSPVPFIGSQTARAAASTGSGRRMAERALTLLATLSPEQQQTISFPFGGKRFQRWNYMTGSAFSPGVPLERITKNQKTAAFELIASGLSRAGSDKANRVIVQQDIWRDLDLLSLPWRHISYRVCVIVQSAAAFAHRRKPPGAQFRSEFAWTTETLHPTQTPTVLPPNLKNIKPSSAG